MRRLGYFCLVIAAAAYVGAAFGQSQQFTLAQLPPLTPITLTSGNVPAKQDIQLLNSNFIVPVNAPLPPGDVFNPVISGSVTPDAPVVSAYTYQGGPDRSISIQGARFTRRDGSAKNSDTAVWMYSQTTADNPRLVRLTTLSEDDSAAIPVLDPGTPYGMYIIWMTNEAGASSPIRVNATEAWWIGPVRAVAGGSVSIYGRNLTYKNGESASYVYLRPWGTSTSMTAATVTRANPYKVSFTVPATATASDYEVWVHNGHGGAYGWSGPFRLKVDASPAYAWSGRVWSVNSFGAVANDTIDDTNAIQAAFNTARDGDIVQFGPGRYVVSRSVYVTRSVAIEGAGRSATIIEGAANMVNQDCVFRVSAFPSRVRNLGLESFAASLYAFGGVLFFDGSGKSPNPSGVYVDNVSITVRSGAPYTSIGTAYLNDVVVVNSVFQAGQALQANRSFQVFFQNNVIRGNWPDSQYSSQAMVALEASNEVDVSSNDAASLNLSASPRQTLARLFLAQGHGHGSTGLHYVAENRGRDLGCTTFTCGEEILFETPGTFFTGPGSMSNATTATFQASWTPRYFAALDRYKYAAYNQQRPALVFIQSGAGAGQWRRIIDNGSNYLTLDRPWDAPPDNTSIFSIITAGHQSVAYKNDLSGMLPSFPGTNIGVAAYGSHFELTIARNQISNIPRGIELSGLTYSSCAAPGAPSSANFCPVWGVLAADNTLSNVGAGVVSYSRLEGSVNPSLGSVLSRIVIRDNTVSNVITGAGQGTAAEGGVVVGDANLQQSYTPWQVGTIIEGNRIADAKNAVILLGLQAATPVRGNLISNGGRYSGMTGIFFQNSYPNSLLFNNSYSGVASRYSGLAPGSTLRLTDRSLRLSSATPQAQVSIRNVGTAAFSPAMSSSSSWIGWSGVPPSLDAEAGAGVSVSLAGSGLQPGAFQGTVSVGGAQNASPQSIAVSASIDMPSPDKTLPLVSIDSPSNGSQVSGSVTISATAQDVAGIAKVEFYVDGSLLGNDSIAPYSWAWDSKTVGNGAHSLLVKAYDTAGNMASVSVPVTVANIQAVPASEANFVTGVRLGSARNNDDSWVGFRMQVGPSPLVVTALGRWISSGNNQAHAMRIWDAAAGQEVAGTRITVQASGASAGQYQYVALPVPVTLQANGVYFILSWETSGRDFWYDFDTSLSTASVATITHAIFSYGDTARFGLAGVAGRSYVPVSFRYSTSSTVPSVTAPPTVTISSPANGATVNGSITVSASVASSGNIARVDLLVDGAAVSSSFTAPYQMAWNTNVSPDGNHAVTVQATDTAGRTGSATIGLRVSNAPVPAPSAESSLITGVRLGTLRNNDDSWVGMRVTIGTQPIFVSSLGRWVVAGNTRPHSLKIVDADTLTDVPGALTSVETAGAPPGAFRYARFGAPVQLTANKSYLILSWESANGDFWYDFDTTVTSTAAASVIGGVYTVGARYGFAGGTGRAYVPVDLTYTLASTVTVTGIDVTQPVVAITSPAAGATLAGTAVLSARASDDRGVYRVEFLVNNQIVGAASAAPYSISWNTMTVPNGSYTLLVRAFDLAGNASAATVAISVNNGSTPASSSKFITSVRLGATPRNNDDSWVGMRVLVGATPVRVAALGRWATAGNNQTHPLKIVDADTGVDVPGSQVSVSLLNTVNGQFVYAQLPAPVTLQAGRAYFVVSREYNGGDLWYDFDTTVTTTSVATVTQAVYSVGPVFGLAGVSNRSYVPVDFQYQ